MKQYVSALSKESCEELISELTTCNVDPSHGHMDLDPSNPFYQDSVNQTTMLKLAGYDQHSVEYRHYQSGVHFDFKYQNMLAELTACTPIMCWVSEIRPGKCTPWHWDINPWENEHAKLGKIIRYFCFLSRPAPGHIFVTADDAYYMEEQGSIYQYEDIHSWHAGSNVGLTPKFLLTLTAYK
jgi:hypothetical protein